MRSTICGRSKVFSVGMIVFLMLFIIGCGSGGWGDPASPKEITTFQFDAANNSGLATDVIGVITGTDITVTVPYGTDVTGLVPTIIHTGTAIEPESGVAQDFTNEITYNVTASDSTERNYTVVVTVAPSDAKEITDFRFATANNSGLATGAIGVITGTGITVTVPYGTDVTGLVPTIIHTGMAVDPESGSAQDFTDEVIYTVTADDSSSQGYSVNVLISTALISISEGFEGDFPPAGWVLAKTGPTDDPGWVQTSSRAYSGTHAIYHNDDSTTGDAISWLISPPVTIPAGGAKLIFWQSQSFASWYLYHGIWISTQTNDTGDFVESIELGAGTDNTWEKKEINLTAYAGQSIYIAFRYKGNFADEWYIDDVSVE